MLRSVWLLAEVLACSFLSEPGKGAALPLNSRAKTSSFMIDLLQRGRFRERLAKRDWSLRTVIRGVKDVPDLPPSSFTALLLSNVGMTSTKRAPTKKDSRVRAVLRQAWRALGRLRKALPGAVTTLVALALLLLHGSALGQSARPTLLMI